MAKILLVEDDNNLREIYEARLQAEGYAIVSAKDGEEALVLAKNEHPDLIISDVMMPKVSGFEMLDILRNTDGLRDTKIIMLTALGQSEDQTRADKLGADRYLVKSQVTLEDIVKVTHELLNEDSATEPLTTDSPVVAAPETSPPATSPVVVNVPVVDAPVATFQPPSTPPVESISLPTTVEPATTPVAEPLNAETTAQEESDVESKIESFINSTPAVPAEPSDEPLPVSVDSSNTQTMTDAIDALMAKPRSEPSSPPTTPIPVEVTPAAVPEIDMSVPTLITPSVPNIDGNVPIANKKIISPLNEEPAAPRTDINVLLAREEAKTDTMNSAPIEQPATASTPEPVKPFDPNNIAL